jgi:hypothetical protein
MKIRDLSSGGRAVLFAPTLLIYVFSTWPQYQFHPPTQSQLIVSLKKRTDKTRDCTPEERKSYEEEQSHKLKHMRKKSKECGTRSRVPLELKVWVDGKESVSKTIKPAGLARDGIVFVFERFDVSSAVHDMKITMRDYRTDRETNVLEFNQRMEFKPRQVKLVTFTPESDTLHVNK